MSTTIKDRLVEGTDLQQQILKFNSENKKSDVLRTPKRHRSDEQRSAVDDDRIILSNDDEAEFQMATHQRKKFQHGDRANDYQEKKEVMFKANGLKHLQQQNIQKERITTSSRTFVNAEMAAMTHHLKRREQTILT
jgi:hypothetical protein